MFQLLLDTPEGGGVAKRVEVGEDAHHPWEAVHLLEARGEAVTECNLVDHEHGKDSCGC